MQGSLQVPRGHTHSQNKTLCRSVSQVWAQTPCLIVKNYNPSHYLLLLKFQVTVSLQNTSPLSYLNFVRAEGLINPSPAVSDQDRLVFKMLVTLRASTGDMLLKSRTWAMGFSGSIHAGDPKGAQLPAAPKEARKLLSMVSSSCLP